MLAVGTDAAGPSSVHAPTHRDGMQTVVMPCGSLSNVHFDMYVK